MCPVTFYLILINAALFFVAVFTGGFTINNLIRLGGLVPSYVIVQKEYYRILLSMFLHGSTIHFLMNMVALYYLGTVMERTMGHIRYLALYFITGIGAGVMIVLFGARNDLTVGASAALYGIMAGLFYITLRKPRWFNPAGVRAIRIMTLINFGITFLFPNISIIGHLSGFVLGFLLCLVLMPDKPDFLKDNRGKQYYDVPKDDDDTVA